MTEYKVAIDVYNGPLDLMLYLIRREEIDIHDIPIARVTKQYVEYVELLQQLDPDAVSEFLVLAATLMEIKTRMLLPGPEIGEGGEEEMGLDPRADLVRQLLQYKAFKDAADNLTHAAASIATTLKKIPEVEALFTVSGKIDFVAIVRVASPAELDSVLDKICALAGVRETRSALVLASKFDRR